MDLELLTIHEVAARLKISRRSADRLVADGVLTVRQVGGRKRFWWPEVLSAFPPQPRRHAPSGAGSAPIDMIEHLRRKAANWNVMQPDEFARARARKQRHEG